MSVFHPSRSIISGAQEISGAVHLTAEGPIPSTPAAGAGGVLYTKADGKPYWKSDDIAEADLTSGSGGGGSGTITALNNQAANRLVTIGSTTTQLDGEANLTFDGSTLTLAGAMTATSLSASSFISGSSFFGDGSNLTGISSGGGSTYTFADQAASPGSLATGSWWYDTTNNILYSRVTDAAGTPAWLDVSTATSTLMIKDADSDTKIQVEESADEDKIRFDTAGSERMVIDESGVTINISGSAINVGLTTARAWISFVGTGTIAIEDSYNVSSITDNGTGGYTITWDTDFPNDDYCAVGMCNDISYGGTLSVYSISSKLTGSLKIATHNKDTQSDAGIAMVSCFGGIA